MEYLTECNLNEKLLKELPDRGIFSKTLMKNEHTSVVLMQLAAGEDLNEHTSKYAVLLQVLDGKGILELGDRKLDLKPGELVYMDPNAPHSVLAIENLNFVLYLLK
ncbi:MAG: cupin domain-containing protein [Balneolales bacterium]